MQEKNVYKNKDFFKHKGICKTSNQQVTDIYNDVLYSLVKKYFWCIHIMKSKTVLNNKQNIKCCIPICFYFPLTVVSFMLRN